MILEAARVTAIHNTAAPIAINVLPTTMAIQPAPTVLRLSTAPTMERATPMTAVVFAARATRDLDVLHVP